MRKLPIAAFALLCAMPAVGIAHHGWSSYDPAKRVTVEATLESVRWANPHTAATIDYQGKRWNVLFAPVARMEARGLSPQIIKPGRKISMVGQPRSDGTTEMKIERLTVDGKNYELR